MGGVVGEKQVFTYKDWIIIPIFIENIIKLLSFVEAIEDYAAKKYWEKNIIEVCQANKNTVLFLGIL